MEHNYRMIAGIYYLIFGLLIIEAIAIIFKTIIHWKIYKKAGKEGWEALIPIYSQVTLLEITNIPVWLIILLLIPGVNGVGVILFRIFTSINLSKAFNKGEGFTIILIIFRIIGLSILAFGKDEYHLPESMF